MTDADMTPFKVFFAIISGCIFLLYGLLYFTSSCENGQYQLGLDFIALTFAAAHTLFFKYKKKMSGLVGLGRFKKLRISMKIIYYFLWLMQPFNIFLDMYIECRLFQFSMNGLIMTFSFSIMLSYLFGKKSGKFINWKVAF